MHDTALVNLGFLKYLFWGLGGVLALSLLAMYWANRNRMSR